MLRTNTISFVTVLICCVLALANEGHDAHADPGLTPEILKTVIYQAINVVLLFGGLVYFLKSAVQTFFKVKKSNFLAAAEKSKLARQAAEDEHLKIKVQLTKLESTADESISRAKADAAEMRKQLLVEAEALSRRIREEAASSAQLEVERAVNTLRTQLIRESVEATRIQLSKVSSEDQSRLQGNFISNIEAVQR